MPATKAPAARQRAMNSRQAAGNYVMFSALVPFCFARLFVFGYWCNVLALALAS